MNITVAKVPDENGKTTFRLWVEWNDCGFNVTILRDTEAWTGNASSDYIEKLSGSVQLTVENYINETKAALSTQGGASHFTYHLESNRFVWKKLDPSTQIKIQYGAIPLASVPFHESVETMLDTLVNQKTNLQTEVMNLKQINTTTSREKGVLMEQLVEYKKQKLKMEEQLFSQFLAVLNTKKEHIRQLEKQITQDKVTPSSNNSVRDDKPLINSDHYDSDTEIEETDDENKANNCSLEDDNLFDNAEPSVSTLPKLSSCAKRPLAGTVIGPSTRKLKKPMLNNELNADDLLEEF